MGVDRVIKLRTDTSKKPIVCADLETCCKLQDGGCFAEDVVERISTAAADGGGVCSEAVENDQHRRHGTSQGAHHWWTGTAGKRAG